MGEVNGGDVPLAQLSSSTMDGASAGKAKWFYYKFDQKHLRAMWENIYFANRITSSPNIGQIIWKAIFIRNQACFLFMGDYKYTFMGGYM